MNTCITFIYCKTALFIQKIKENFNLRRSLVPGKKKNIWRPSETYIRRPPHNYIAPPDKIQVKDWYTHALDEAFLRRTSTIKTRAVVVKLNFLPQGFGA